MKADSKLIYACQLFGIAAGVIMMALFNHRVIGFWQFLLGIVLGWFIGLGTYLIFLSIKDN